MDFLHIYLDEFASIYENSLENIRKVETLAAISAINHNFTNNIRHALEHLSIAIKFALQNNPDKEQSTNYMKEAISHISNLAPDSCQHIAGKRLKELRVFMGSSGFFANVEHAKKIHEEAIYFYTQGRNVRTASADEAVEYFIKTIERCIEAQKLVQFPGKIQKTTLLIALSGWIITIMLFFDKIFKFL